MEESKPEIKPSLSEQLELKKKKVQSVLAKIEKSLHRASIKASEYHKKKNFEGLVRSQFYISLLALEQNFCISDIDQKKFRKYCCSRLNRRQIDLNLQKTQGEELLTVQRALWHGLANDEPLVFESIIEGCYNNPSRRKFPFFLKNKGEDYLLDDEHKSA